MSRKGHHSRVLSQVIGALAWSAAMMLASSMPAQARQDVVPGSRYTSARAAAMGDAGLPIADDAASALFYNPASLAKIRENYYVEPLNFSLYGNSNYFGQFSVPTTSGGGFSAYKITSLQGYLPTLQANTGKYTGVGTAIVPTVYFKGISFGILYQTQLGAQYMSDDTVHYRSLYQLIPTAGIGTKLAGGVVKIGYSLQWVNQASGNMSGVQPSDPNLAYSYGLNQGSALSHNFGFTLTFPYQNLPQFNVVARNIGGAHYTGTSLMSFAKNPQGAPATDPMSIDTSLSLISKMGSGLYSTFVVEYRDATASSGVSPLGRAVAGLEISFRDIVSIRGGWGGGYPHAGIGIQRGKSNFSLTYTNEEVGNGYHDQKDTRFMLQYQMRAF